jgi:hypothetical protein
MRRWGVEDAGRFRADPVFDEIARLGKKYRDSPEGREQHRDEESERRERQQLEPVGDRRLEPGHGQLQAVATAAPYARADEEDRDGADADQGERVEWVLVAWPGACAEAERLLGAQATCPWCGRRGVVARVVSLDDWREEDES